MRHSSRFLSTFRTARVEFGAGGRQKWGISTGFCLLSRPHESNLESQVDKNETFTPVFVYFRGRAGRICRQRQTKMRHSPRFLSTFEAVHLKSEGGGRTFFRPLRATRSDYGQNAVFWRLARKCQSPITRQNVDSWNLSVNGKYAAAIFPNSISRLPSDTLDFTKSTSHRKI